MKNKNRITITSVSLTVLLAIAVCGGSKRKQVLYEIVKSVYHEKPAGAAGRSKDPGLKLMGNRFLTFSTLVWVRQIFNP